LGISTFHAGAASVIAIRSSTGDTDNVVCVPVSADEYRRLKDTDHTSLYPWELSDSELMALEASGPPAAARDIRPAVVRHQVINGLRSGRGGHVHAGYASVIDLIGPTEVENRRRTLSARLYTLTRTT